MDKRVVECWDRDERGWPQIKSGRSYRNFVHFWNLKGDAIYFFKKQHFLEEKLNK